MKDWSKIESTLDEISWQHIAPHHERQVVILLHPDLEILEVGQRIHQDDKQIIESLLEAEMISKPSPTQTANWDQSPNKTFKCLIVAPFVLIQELKLN